MVKLTRIYTRGGDKGQTSLGDGARIAKDDLRIQAGGAVDETNSVIGIARLSINGDIDAMLGRIQDDLFDLGADLCVPEEGRKGKAGHEPLRITEKQVKRLEDEIDAMNANLADLTSFILPGGKPAAAYLHLGRTVARRAECLMVGLNAREAINVHALTYINRLSDPLFVASRHINDDGATDVLWRPGTNR